MKVAIHQPNLLPWLGFFQKLFWSDTFVLFDDVQAAQSNSFVSRIKIKTSTGEKILTFPSSQDSSYSLISDVQVVNDPRKLKKLLKTIQLAYTKAPYFEQVYPKLEDLFVKRWKSVVERNEAFLLWFIEENGKTTRLIRSSQIDRAPSTQPGLARLLEILSALGAKEYLSGSGAGSRRYIKPEDFEKAGIKLNWQLFEHPAYMQLHGDFVSGLSVLDSVFMRGLNSIATLVEYQGD